MLRTTRKIAMSGVDMALDHSTDPAWGRRGWSPLCEVPSVWEAPPWSTLRVSVKAADLRCSNDSAGYEANLVTEEGYFAGSERQSWMFWIASRRRTAARSQRRREGGNAEERARGGEGEWEGEESEGGEDE